MPVFIQSAINKIQQKKDQLRFISLYLHALFSKTSYFLLCNCTNPLRQQTQPMYIHVVTFFGSRLLSRLFLFYEACLFPYCLITVYQLIKGKKTGAHPSKFTEVQTHKVFISFVYFLKHLKIGFLARLIHLQTFN